MNDRGLSDVVSTSFPDAAATGERRALGELARFLDDAQSTPARVVGSAGTSVALPPSAHRLLQELAGLLAEGQVVTVLAVDKELTTQQAADLLNVSRPYLIQLLDRDEVPFRMTGTHRRIRLDDLMAYKRRRDAQRKEQLRDLTRLSAEMGLYQTTELDVPIRR